MYIKSREIFENDLNETDNLMAKRNLSNLVPVINWPPLGRTEVMTEVL